MQLLSWLHRYENWLNLSRLNGKVIFFFWEIELVDLKNSRRAMNGGLMCAPHPQSVTYPLPVVGDTVLWNWLKFSMRCLRVGESGGGQYAPRVLIYTSFYYTYFQFYYTYQAVFTIPIFLLHLSCSCAVEELPGCWGEWGYCVWGGYYALIYLLFNLP